MGQRRRHGLAGQHRVHRHLQPVHRPDRRRRQADRLPQELPARADVHVPQGFTYAVAGADYRGFAHLERGASASETANYYFQGEPQTTRIRHGFTGPSDGDWQRTDTVGVSSLSFLPCGEQRYLNVNTELRVNRGWSDTRNTTSFLTMDSTDGSIDTVYHVAWKHC